MSLNIVRTQENTSIQQRPMVAKNASGTTMPVGVLEEVLEEEYVSISLDKSAYEVL